MPRGGSSSSTSGPCTSPANAPPEFASAHSVVAPSVQREPTTCGGTPSLCAASGVHSPPVSSDA